MTYVSTAPLVGCLVLIALAVLIGTFALPLLPILLRRAREVILRHLTQNWNGSGKN